MIVKNFQSYQCQRHFSIYNNLRIYMQLLKSIQKSRMIFPTKIQHLDQLGNQIEYVHINQNDPTVKDKEYVERRHYFQKKVKNHKMNSPIAIINYTPQQHALWRRIVEKAYLYQLKVAQKKYLQNLQELKAQTDFHKRIPDPNKLSRYLQAKSGFRIKPVGGMISQRQFLNCMAFKVFCCGQFIRHPQCEQFSPVPDIIHQYLGHIPAFANKQIANITHQIGLLSLGASDQVIRKLGYAYLHCLEFGICKQQNQTKVYGAGTCACIVDMKKIVSNQFQAVPFDPENNWKMQFDYTAQQTRFYATETIDEALTKLKNFGKSMKRDFRCQYDEHTEEINIIEL